jgi:hypothetical protein
VLVHVRDAFGVDYAAKVTKNHNLNTVVKELFLHLPAYFVSKSTQNITHTI